RALHNLMANVQAMATAWAGGVAFGLAKAKGFDVRAIGVNEWRQALIGHSRKGDNVDAKVRAFLTTFVRQMPARTNAHSRDAAGVACVGFRQWSAGWINYPRKSESTPYAVRLSSNQRHHIRLRAHTSDPMGGANSRGRSE